MGLGVASLGEDARFVPHRGGGTCSPPNLALVRRRVGILLLRRSAARIPPLQFGGKDTAAPVRRQGYCRSSSAVRKPPLLERLVDGADSARRKTLHDVVAPSWNLVLGVDTVRSRCRRLAFRRVWGICLSFHSPKERQEPCRSCTAPLIDGALWIQLVAQTRAKKVRKKRWEIVSQDGEIPTTRNRRRAIRIGGCFRLPGTGYPRAV